MCVEAFSRRRLCVLVLALLSVGGVSASSPSLRVQAPSAALSVGDPLQLRVVAAGGEDGLWGELKIETPEDGDWALLEGPTPIPGSAPPAWGLSIAPLKVGKIPLPAISVRWRTGEDSPQEIKPVDEQEMTVASVISPDDQKGAAPLKDPLGVQGFPWEWVLPIAVFLLLTAALISLVFRLKRRKKTAEAGIPALPPWEEFRRAMKEVEGRIGREATDGICDRMAFILRRYLERRSDRPAAEMTSSELRFLARELQWPSQAQIDLQKVMRLFDAVRFARKSVSEAELREGADRARAIARALEGHYLPREEEDAA